MSKVLDHDSFIDGVFYKAGSPVPPKATVPAQVAPTDELTADMTVDELIDFFRNGHGPKSAAAIIDRLDVAALDNAELLAKLDAKNSNDTDAAQLIATANKERDDAVAELDKVTTERGIADTERDSAMQQIADLTKERDELKKQLDEATAPAGTAAPAKTAAKAK